jgi:hypothetical protein
MDVYVSKVSMIASKRVKCGNIALNLPSILFVESFRKRTLAAIEVNCRGYSDRIYILVEII